MIFFYLFGRLLFANKSVFPSFPNLPAKRFFRSIDFLYCFVISLVVLQIDECLSAEG